MVLKNITKGWITTALGALLIVVGVVLQFMDLTSVYALIWECIGLVLILSPDKLVDAIIHRIKK